VSDEEARFLLLLGAKPFAYADIASISRMPADRFGLLFEGLVRKGMIWPPIGGTADLYQVAGIMVGWFEVYLSNGQETPEQREFSRRLDRLFKSWGRYNTFPLRSLLNYRVRHASPQQSIVAVRGTGETSEARRITVDRTVPTAPPKIYPARTVGDLIEEHGDANNIVAVHCFCRQYHKMVDEPCRFEHPPQSCLAIGPLAGNAVRNGGGRRLSKQEARALIAELQRKGAVHQVFHQDEDVDKPEIAICNCCWDCCGVFGSYNRGIMPLNLKSYFEARIVSGTSTCSGCGTCTEHCPVAAISLHDHQPRIDGHLCIGCGQCEFQCPEDAIELVPHERTVMLPLVKRSEARIQWQ